MKRNQLYRGRICNPCFWMFGLYCKWSWQDPIFVQKELTQSWGQGWDFFGGTTQREYVNTRQDILAKAFLWGEIQIIGWFDKLFIDFE